MRKLNFICFGVLLTFNVNGQDTPQPIKLSGIFSDSTTIRIHREIPPEFDAASQVNEYYSEIDKSNHFNILKLRADCMFIHEIHSKPYNSIIRRELGTYKISGDTIYLADEPYYNRELSDTIIQTPSGPVTYKR